jgi:MFS superfamily sulfate permease-like transporter
VDHDPRPRWFVLLAEAIDDVDFTGAQTLLEVARQLAERNVVFAIARVQPGVLAELDRFGFTDTIGHDHVYPTLPAAIAAFHAS